MKLKINSFSLRFAWNIIFYSANTFLISSYSIYLQARFFKILHIYFRVW